MANRIISIIAVGMVAGASILGVLVVWQNMVSPREFRPANSSKSAQVASTSPKTAKQGAPLSPAAKKKSESETTVPPALSPGAPDFARQYKLTETDAAMDKARAEKAKNPQYRDGLGSWYIFLADPSFTQSTDYTEHIDKLKELADETPDSPTPWIAIAQATLYLAWQERGFGPNELVSEKDRQHFEKRAVEARIALEQATRIGVKDGKAHSLLLEVARIEGWPLAQARAAFDEGRQIDPLDDELYSEMAEYLLPQWRGQPGDVERFALESQQLLGGDEGLDMYMHIAYAVNQYDSNLLLWGSFNRELLARAAVVAAERYPNARNLVPFAALCTIVAQDRSAARKIRPLVKSNQAERVWLWAYVAEDFFRWCDENDFNPVPIEWLWGAPRNYPPLVFAADSKRLWCPSGAAASAVIQWDWQKRTAETVLPTRDKRIGNIAVDPAKNWVAGTLDGERHAGWMLWQEPDSNSEPYIFDTTDACNAIAIHPKLPRVAFSVRDDVRIMDLETKTESRPIACNDDVRGMRFSDDGQLLVVWGRRIAVYDAARGERQYELPCAGDIPSEAADAIGHACEQIVGFDGEGRVWAITFALNSRPVKRSLVRFAANGKSLESVISDLQNPAPIQPLNAVLSADRRLLVVSGEVPKFGHQEEICVWNVATGKSRRFAGSHDHVGSFAISPDGRWLASVSQSGGPVKIWDLKW